MGGENFDESRLNNLNTKRLTERIDIEIIKEFRIRHEDYYFALTLLMVALMFNTMFVTIGLRGTFSMTPIIIGLIIFDLLLIAAVIFNSWYHYKERLTEKIYIENGRVIKTQRGLVIFDYPLESIISVRIQNKKGNEGTVILFTDPRSLNYSIMYGMPNKFTPFACHGFTDYKVSFAKNRKLLVTEIYKVNPKLHFIESY